MATTVISNVQRKIFKSKEDVDRFYCPRCKSVLQEPVQITCGHRMCKSCADELLATEKVPTCVECNEEIVEEDGAKVNTYVYSVATTAF